MIARRFGFCICLLAWLLCLPGCEVGPDYVKPDMDLPENWTQYTVPATAASIKEWWKSLNDPVLDKLVEKALANNQDRQVAEARIREARAGRLTAAAKLYPQIGSDVQAAHGQPGALTFNETFDIYQPQLDATFEIDLFGGNRRAVEAQDAVIEARQAAYQDFSLSLIAEVASEYTTYRELQLRKSLTDETVETQKALYDLNEIRMKAGLASQLDTSQAETLYRTTEAQAPLIDRQLAETGFRLTLLLGENPGAEDAELKETKPVPAFTALPALSAPESIIEQRPDVKVAERTLAANTALQGVAISELYPKITLSGLFGLQNTNLFPEVETYEVAGDFALPILNFGSIQGQVDAADARQIEAFHAYKQSVLGALADVETHMSDLAKEQRRQDDLEKVVKSSERTYKLARSRYDSGLAPFLDVLDAQERLYNNQIELAATTGNATRYAIALSKALGVY
jgi:NodT family efflux transporter outer membrane factor (OMF) lipoprotein